MKRLSILIFWSVLFQFVVGSVVDIQIEKFKNRNIERDVTSFSLANDKSFKDKFTVKKIDLLPFELQKMIFEYLSPGELFEIMQNNDFQKYHNIVAEAFGLSYGNHYTVSYQIKKGDTFIIQNDEIYVNNFKTFFTFLTSFNKRIKKLQINISSFRGSELQQTLDLIDKKCASTLTKFEIKHIFSKELDMIAAFSFPKVEELVIFSCYFRNETIDFRHSFPNIRRLSVTQTKFIDRLWVEMNFSNLTHLQVEMRGGYFRETEILRILEKNPTISSLGLIDFSTSILRTIDKSFPNIVNLGLVALSNTLDMNNEVHHMKHIRRFSFDGVIYHKKPHFIQFETLNELRWSSESSAEFILIDLIQSHQNQIEVLEIENTVISDDHLSLMTNLTKLRSASLRFNTNLEGELSATGIWNFINSNIKLEELWLLKTHQKLRQDLCNSLNKAKITGWLELSDPRTDHTGNVYFTKHLKAQIKYRNQLQFLKERFIRIY